MTKHFFKSDFKIVDSSGDYETYPFKIEFWTSDHKRKFIAEYDGENYKNCAINNRGALVVHFKDHNLGVGVLKAEKTFFIPDAEGTGKASSVGFYDVKLTMSAEDMTVTDEETSVEFSGSTITFNEGKMAKDGDGVDMLNTIDVVQDSPDGEVTIFM